MRFIIFFYISSVILIADETSYAIVLCNTTTEQKALECKTEFEQSANLSNITIQLQPSGRFKTLLGEFKTSEEAKKYRFKILNQIDRKLDLSIDMVSTKNQPLPKENTKVSNINEVETKIVQKEKLAIIEKSENEPETLIVQKRLIKSTDLNSVFEATKPVELVSIHKSHLHLQESNESNISNTHISIAKPKVSEKKSPILFSNINFFDNLLIEVNSSSHKLMLYGIKNGNQVLLKNYIVSTARRNIPKPLGLGGVSAISLNPDWYPTQKTIDYFREKKGINLSTVVEYGDPNNYMGAAKINLTHSVNGENVYRIHGTVNESTIGTNESSGCIRMKNNEVKELAIALKKFISFRSLRNIDVVLK